MSALPPTADIPLPRQPRGFTRHCRSRVPGAFLAKRAPIGDPFAQVFAVTLATATATERLTLDATRHHGASGCPARLIVRALVTPCDRKSYTMSICVRLDRSHCLLPTCLP